MATEMPQDDRGGAHVLASALTLSTLLCAGCMFTPARYRVPQRESPASVERLAVSGFGQRVFEQTEGVSGYVGGQYVAGGRKWWAGQYRDVSEAGGFRGELGNTRCVACAEEDNGDSPLRVGAGRALTLMAARPGVAAGEWFDTSAGPAGRCQRGVRLRGEPGDDRNRCPSTTRKDALTRLGSRWNNRPEGVRMTLRVQAAAVLASGLLACTTVARAADSCAQAGGAVADEVTRQCDCCAPVRRCIRGVVESAVA